MNTEQAQAEERVLFEARVSPRKVQPGWVAPTPATARSGLRIRARDVEGIEWAGYDNIGIRMKDGRVESVCFTHRIGTANQALARRAILNFVERATGRAEPRAREVAPWVVHQPS